VAGSLPLLHDPSSDDRKHHKRYAEDTDCTRGVRLKNVLVDSYRRCPPPLSSRSFGFEAETFGTCRGTWTPTQEGGRPVGKPLFNPENGPRKPP
jgi:hypothetical protein